MLIYKHTFVEKQFHYLFKCDYFNEKKKRLVFQLIIGTAHCPVILVLSSYFYCSTYRHFIIILFYFACIIIATFSVCLFITLIYKLHFLLLVLSYHALYVLFCNAFLGSILTSISVVKIVFLSHHALCFNITMHYYILSSNKGIFV